MDLGRPFELDEAAFLPPTSTGGIAPLTWTIEGAKSTRGPWTLLHEFSHRRDGPPPLDLATGEIRLCLAPLRPLATGAVTRRWGEKATALQSADAFRRALAPLNVGVAMRGGCQTMGLGVQAALDEGMSDFAADAKDAYQNGDRQGMLEAYSQACPETYAVAYTVDRTPRKLLVRMRGSSTGAPAIILSCQGTQQGGPLGPAKFCLGQQPHLRRFLSDFRTLFPGVPVQLIADLDDVHVQTQTDHMVACINMFTTRWLDFNLELNPAKNIWCIPSHVAPPPPEGRSPGIPLTSAGVVVCGSAAGTPEFIQEHLQQKAQEASTTLADLGAIANHEGNLHLAVAALAFCGSSQLVHLARSHVPSLTAQAVPQYDNAQ